MIQLSSQTIILMFTLLVLCFALLLYENAISYKAAGSAVIRLIASLTCFQYTKEFYISLIIMVMNPQTIIEISNDIGRVMLQVFKKQLTASIDITDDNKKEDEKKKSKHNDGGDI